MAPNCGTKFVRVAVASRTPSTTPDLHVLQDLALATELARRIECDLEPALALLLDDLRHAPAADHQRMLRIENAGDLEGLCTSCAEARAGERSEHDRSEQCTLHLFLMVRPFLFADLVHATATNLPHYAAR